MICFNFYSVGPIQEITRYIKNNIRICGKEKKVCIDTNNFSDEKNTFNQILEILNSSVTDKKYRVEYNDKGC